MTDPSKKILVLNLTRMGDILQSTPLLMALKAANQNAHISYLAVNGFAEVCRFIPEIDQLIPFDFNSSVAVSKEAISMLPRRLKEIDQVIAGLKAEHFDVVINLSHSKISAIICHLLDVPQTMGLTLDTQGYRLIRHPWARYFFTANLNRRYNRFNLVDVNLGLALPVGEFANANADQVYPFGKVKLSFKTTTTGTVKANKILDSWAGKEATFKVGFQPGASIDCKRWSVQSFSDLGKMLQQRLGAAIILFGVKSESPLAEAINKNLQGTALDLTGKTNIEVLGSLLEQIDLLITNDTGTQHLAAAVGTPVLSLSFGSAVSHETAPYGPGHLVLEAALPCNPCSFQVKCKRFVCQEVVKPEAVFIAATKLLHQQFLTSPYIEDDPIFNRVNLWLTDFDQDGFWLQRPLLRRPIKGFDFINLCAREIWKQALLAQDDVHIFSSPWNAQILKNYLTDYLPPNPELFSKELLQSCAALLDLEQAAMSGVQQTWEFEQIYTADKSNVEQLSALTTSMEETDQGIVRTGFRLAAVNHLVLDFTFNKQNLQGSDLLHLAQRTREIYQRLFNLAHQLRMALESWEEALLRDFYDSINAEQTSGESGIDKVNLQIRMTEELFN